MTANPRRIKKVELGSIAWISLLSNCIDAIGSENFPDSLIAALSSITDFDYSVSFAYYQNEKPICLYNTFSPEKHVVFVDDYLKGPYLLDPFFKACNRKVGSGLYRLRDIAPDRFYQSEYYRSYYVQTGLAEEICYIIYLAAGVAVAVSLMRAGGQARFTAREFRLLESVSPIILSLIQRHWQGLVNQFEAEPSGIGDGENRDIIENTVEALFSPRITPRETQVVAQVLEGHSSEAISRDLGISVGTVRIHRRNIYAKLNISSQQELFAIFFQTIKNLRN